MATDMGSWNVERTLEGAFLVCPFLPEKGAEAQNDQERGHQC